MVCSLDLKRVKDSPPSAVAPHAAQREEWRAWPGFPLRSAWRVTYGAQRTNVSTNRQEAETARFTRLRNSTHSIENVLDRGLRPDRFWEPSPRPAGHRANHK